MEQEISHSLIQDEAVRSPVPSGDQKLPCMGHLKRLLGCRTSRVVPPEHVIFTQGEPPHSICLLCSGVVKLTHTNPNGGRVILGTRQKGWILGAVSRLLNLHYEVTAETVTRSRLCLVPSGVFLDAMASDIKFAGWITLMMSLGLRDSLLRISDQSTLSGRQRLEKFLWMAAQAKNGSNFEKSTKIQMSLKSWEVAQLLAISPQHLCRLIKQLEKEGVVERRNGWLIVPNPGKLWNSEAASGDMP